jgi:iron complex transport system ATP-binding protein
MLWAGERPDYNEGSDIDLMDFTISHPAPPLVELRNVTVVRNGRPVLHEVNLRIEAGEHVAIMGPNGSGKSTLIKTITRELYPRYDGRSSMKLFGQESWNVFDLRSMLGIVTNDVAPFYGRPVTGRDAVLSGFFSSVGLPQHQQIQPGMREKTDELLAWLEIGHLSGRVVGEMSSGEVRRVMIARALVHQPKALLFDEPSNSLDVFAQVELRRTMSKLAQSGIALLLITHHLPDVVPEIERVIFMRDGRIVADGGKAELLTAAGLGGLFGCPVQITQQDGYYHLVS